MRRILLGAMVVILGAAALTSPASKTGMMVIDPGSPVVSGIVIVAIWAVFALTLIKVLKL